jgi:hypothetical protein
MPSIDIVRSRQTAWPYAASMCKVRNVGPQTIFSYELCLRIGSFHNSIPSQTEGFKPT